MKKLSRNFFYSIQRWIGGCAAALIYIYQKGISPYLGAHCRFYPTCSEYGRQAICKQGFFRGSILLIIRLLKCQPFHRGGYDPVGK